MRIHIAHALWNDLTRELYRRTEQRHESGAFLLGHIDSSDRIAEEIIYYDDLDPKAYDHRICTLGPRAFGNLWERCAELQLSVVADAHVHFLSAKQSHTDKRNPMIALPGHLALIFPDMAHAPIRLNELGIYEYLGSHQWRSLGGRNASRVLVLEASP